MPENIDYRFLAALEGGSRTTGYVPASGVSRSGVTIATGFDLGQRNESDLHALRLGPAIIAKLRPYLGARGPHAQALLAKAALDITPSEAQAIDECVRSAHIARVKFKYDTTPGNTRRFADLPPQAQTVIASVAFQYGVGLDLRTPRFWKAATNRDWPEAIRVLKSFGDAYPTRRMKEAALLEQIR